MGEPESRKRRLCVKPRDFRSGGFSCRGRCTHEGEDRSRVVDASMDVYDDATTASDMKRFARWLNKAAKWLESP